MCSLTESLPSFRSEKAQCPADREPISRERVSEDVHVKVPFILTKRLLRLLKPCLIFLYAKTYETSVTLDVTS